LTRRNLEKYQVLFYLAAIGCGLTVGMLMPDSSGIFDALLWPILALLLYTTFTQVPLVHLRQALTDARFLTPAVVSEIPFRSLPMRADPTGSVFRSESGTIPARVYRQHILSPDLREVPWRLTGKRLSPTIQAERRFAESEVNSMKKVLLISGIALFLFCLALSPASAYTQHLQVVSQDCSGDQPPPPGPEKP
jgi:hypothetical protein